MDVGAWPSTLSGHGVALASATFLAPLGFVAAGVAAGARLSWWGLLLLVPAWFVAPRVRTQTPTLLWVLLVVGWWWRVPGFSWWCLAGAAFVLVGHTATALFAVLPAQTTLEPATRRRYAARLGVVMAVTVAVTVVAAVLRSHPVGGYAPFAVATVLAACGLLLALRREPR